MKSTFPMKVLSLQCVMAVASLDAVKTIAADASASGTIEEVIVTAEKRKESINEVPMSISALTGDQLAEKGIASVADLAKVVSGFRYTEGNNGTPVYSIRGVGFNETSLGALANATPDVRGVFRETPAPLHLVPGFSADVQPAVDDPNDTVHEARPFVPKLADGLGSASRPLSVRLTAAIIAISMIMRPDGVSRDA